MQGKADRSEQAKPKGPRHSLVITPGTKLVTLFNWRRIGRGVRKSSSSPPWVLPV